MNAINRVIPLLLVVLSAIFELPRGTANANGAPPPAAVDDGLRQKASHVLRTALEAEQQWIKVHAAEALLSLDESRGVTRTFEIELASKGGEPEYRIGIWRVLAQAAPSVRQREQWIGKILAAYLDTRGPDRLHAAETLAKLGYRASEGEAEAFDLVARTGRNPLAANALWVLANSGRPDGETRLAELLDSADGGTRATAAYAIRHLAKLSSASWEKLAAAVRKEPGDAIVVRVSLLSAAFVHAPLDQRAHFKAELLKYAGSGTDDEKYEVCAALAKEGQSGDLPLLVGLLDNSNPDVRVGAAHAILLIARREPVSDLSGQQANLGYDDTPMQPGGRWHIHDGRRPQPAIVLPGPASAAPAPAPADAIVLIGSRDDLSAWQMTDGAPASWAMKNGILETGKGFIRTKAEFTDFQLHVEFATPSAIKGNGQERGNSGVFLLGKFEIQVLDSYKNPTYPDGQAAAMYGQYPPLVNASRPPGEWQTYDIVFTAPRFTQAGTLDKPAVVSVAHNGVLVHNATAFWGPTAHRKIDPYTPDTAKGPIALQDHGNPVRYRNIWIRTLHDDDAR